MHRRILVTDDSADMLDLLSHALSKVGYEVVRAESAEEALAIQSDQEFPLQIIDLNLPGLSGLELCQKIREDDAVSVLIAISAHISVYEVVDAREAGFDDLFYKPFAPAILVEAADIAFARMERWQAMSRDAASS
jgi:DNA-binding response OmpR family regulator